VKRRMANVHFLAALATFAAWSAASFTALADPPPAHAIVAHEFEPPPAEAPTVEPPPPVPLMVAPPPPPSEGPSRKVVALYAGGFAVVAAGAGTVFGILALNNKSNFDKNPTHESADYGNEYAYLCDAAFAGAVLAGVTSVLLYLHHDTPPSPLPTSSTPAVAGKSAAFTFTAAPIVTLHGAGAGAVLRF